MRTDPGTGLTVPASARYNKLARNVAEVKIGHIALVRVLLALPLIGEWLKRKLHAQTQHIEAELGDHLRREITAPEGNA